MLCVRFLRHKSVNFYVVNWNYFRFVVAILKDEFAVNSILTQLPYPLKHMQDFQNDNFWIDPGDGGLTIVEIAKCREIVWNEERISQQWKDPPPSQI